MDDMLFMFYLFILGGVVDGIVCDERYIYTYTYFSIYPGCIRVIRNSWFIFLEVPTSTDLHSIFPLKIQGEIHVYITRWNMIGSIYIYILGQQSTKELKCRLEDILCYVIFHDAQPHLSSYYALCAHIYIYICLYVVVYVCTIYTHRIIPPQMGETGWNRGKAMVWQLAFCFVAYDMLWTQYKVGILATATKDKDIFGKKLVTQTHSRILGISPIWTITDRWKLEGIPKLKEFCLSPWWATSHWWWHVLAPKDLELTKMKDAGLIPWLGCHGTSLGRPAGADHADQSKTSVRLNERQDWHIIRLATYITYILFWDSKSDQKTQSVHLE